MVRSSLPEDFFSSGVATGTEQTCPGIQEKPGRRILHMSEAQGKPGCGDVIVQRQFPGSNYY